MGLFNEPRRHEEREGRREEGKKVKREKCNNELVILKLIKDTLQHTTQLLLNLS
jgi:hypothetical protein